ncbi:hypothetical protein LC612_30735 [Nostoc sp. CHAB 5834]|nr:hypothetical protein [Nostoc sp. CHAB 5834]
MQKLDALNYTTQAMEDIGELALVYKKNGNSSTAESLGQVMRLMGEAVKFNLPDHGELVALDHLDDAFSELVRLPFDAVCLEAPFPSVDNVYEKEGNFEESLSTRRISFAWSSNLAARYPGLCSFGPRKGFYVASVYYSDNFKSWLICPTTNFIPDCPSISINSTLPSEGYAGREYEHLVERGLVKPNTSNYECYASVMLPELVSLLIQTMGSNVDAMARLSMDLRDETATAIGFCLTVNTSNVGRKALDVPEKLNKKRLNNGKPPFFETWVLDLNRPTKGKPVAAQSEAGDIGRLSPRLHLRRGHIRRLDGKTVYVRAATVGSATAGVVDKVYRIS